MRRQAQMADDLLITGESSIAALRRRTNYDLQRAAATGGNVPLGALTRRGRGEPIGTQ